jgi:hypothetical protein
VANATPQAAGLSRINSPSAHQRRTVKHHRMP